MNKGACKRKGKSTAGWGFDKSLTANKQNTWDHEKSSQITKSKAHIASPLPLTTSISPVAPLIHQVVYPLSQCGNSSQFHNAVNQRSKASTSMEVETILTHTKNVVSTLPLEPHFYPLKPHEMHGDRVQF